MYGVLLIVVLIITGGAIAFIGDRLGSKVGKKKLSIFGLRPRHTSIIVTIFTGVCITTLTFGVMAAFGFSINTLTMFGMVLAIGLLVDDAIVVVENVARVM